LDNSGGKKSSLSVWIAAGLAFGLFLGLAASFTRWRWLNAVAVGVEPAGTVWINLIRMVVFPLVVAALVSGVAGLGDVRRLGRLGLSTFAFIFGTILLAALVGLGAALIAVPLAALPPEIASSLRGAASAGAQDVAAQAARVQGFRQFVLDLVPVNPVRAAADGALLPVIVFSVLLGAAVSSLGEQHRRTIVGFADAVTAAIIALIGWIMRLAPVGVACLTAPVTARYGWDMLASLGVFVATVVTTITLFGAAVFIVLAGILGGVTPRRFWSAIAPSTAVGFTTGSSLAALPAMLETATSRLAVSSPVASFVLPLSASLNRPGSAIYHTVSALFIAGIYGIDLSAVQYAVIVSTTFLMTFSVASVPSATVFTLAPVLLSVGLPVEGVALLLGIDRIPDMFRTGLHCVGHMTVAVVVSRGEGDAPA
jgi:DAACS family dicarboxylate/amino acid:cation (Na+ or H+) symporter